MDARAWELPTTLKGMPYGGPPKSGCVRPEEGIVLAIQVALMGLTGTFEMSVFHMLSAGNTEHVVPGTSAARALWGSDTTTTSDTEIAAMQAAANLEGLIRSRTTRWAGRPCSGNRLAEGARSPNDRGEAKHGHDQ